ncbi:MAG: TraR/DksA family transcriptional regulator [SAR324 cluster bacterium]|nr:TraR/DksA family transcriptional regulator [SAR324 cluster bacterium]MCZ6748656.1 TraR/DksA family transcriptional regulator [SAR324 cluster bacterium]
MPRKKKTFKRLEHIDDATLDKIIVKLDDMREESLGIVNNQVQTDLKPRNQESDVGDESDHASEDRDREFSLLMHERHLRRLQQVEDAFERIKEGTYGLCEGTEEPINSKRLMIMPLARYSIEFQQEQEKTLGRNPDELHYDDGASLDSDED